MHAWALASNNLGWARRHRAHGYGGDGDDAEAAARRACSLLAVSFSSCEEGVLARNTSMYSPVLMIPLAPIEQQRAILASIYICL